VSNVFLLKVLRWRRTIHRYRENIVGAATQSHGSPAVFEHAGDLQGWRVDLRVEQYPFYSGSTRSTARPTSGESVECDSDDDAGRENVDRPANGTSRATNVRPFHRLTSRDVCNVLTPARFRFWLSGKLQFEYLVAV